MSTRLDPILEMFHAQAEVQAAQGGRASIDEALQLLAGWIGATPAYLSEDDLAMLMTIGGMLFRTSRARPPAPAGP